MIVRRYGQRIHRVTPRFDARALTEIGFSRETDAEWAAEDFDARFERGETRELTAHAEGDVKHAVEEALLTSLHEQLDALAGGLSEGDVLLVENRAGNDHPKTRDTTSGETVAGERRLHFTYTVEPPLRVTICRPRD
ncbi:MAG: hypothetical protein ACRELV_15125 [Longimicrobiales bacterium]